MKKFLIIACLSFTIPTYSHQVSTKQLLAIIESQDNIKEFTVSGLNINSKDTEGKTLLMYASCADYYRPHKSEELVAYLLSQPAIDINTKDKNGHTALSYAAAGNSSEILELLLQQPTIHINTQDNSGHTPLMVAIIFSSSQRVKRILAHPKINLFLTDHSGKTALMWATSFAHQGQDEQKKVAYIKAGLKK